MSLRGTFTLSALFFLLLLATMLCASGETIIVDDDGGSWSDYTEIQDAIDNSTAGDIIKIYSGTYAGGLDVKYGITLIGNGTSNTIIEGQNDVPAINISAGNTSIHLIKFDGKRIYQPIIRIKNHSATIDQCTITGSGSTGIYNPGWDYHIITNNTISNCDSSGIFLDYTIRTTIQGNNIVNNSLSHSYTSGLHVQRSSKVSVIDNSINHNHGYGLHIEGSYRVTARGNNASDNGKSGIYVESTERSNVTSNTCNNNTVYGIFLSGSDNNHIDRNICYHNLNKAIYISSSYYNQILFNDINGSAVGQYSSSSNIIYSTHVTLTGSFNDEHIGRLGMPVQPSELMGTHYENITKWSWDFDESDGIQEDSSEITPQHTYATPGTYVITVSTTDDLTTTTRTNLTVQICSPYISIEDKTGDVMDEHQKKVGGYPDIDITTVDIYRNNAITMVHFSVAGTFDLRSTSVENLVLPTNLYSVGLFLNDTDDLKDINDADIIYALGLGKSQVENSTSGMSQDIQYQLKDSNSTIVVFIPNDIVGVTSYRAIAYTVSTVGYDKFNDDFESFHLDWTVDAKTDSNGGGSNSDSDGSGASDLLSGIIEDPIKLGILIILLVVIIAAIGGARSRKKKGKKPSKDRTPPPPRDEPRSDPRYDAPPEDRYPQEQDMYGPPSQQRDYSEPEPDSRSYARERPPSPPPQKRAVRRAAVEVPLDDDMSDGRSSRGYDDRRKPEPEPEEEDTAPAYPCVYCGDTLRWIEAYSAWYCEGCNKYND